MRDAIRNLSDRAEFLVVTTLCFSYLVIASLWMLLSGQRQAEMTTGQVLYGIVFEILVLTAVFGILHIRGWRMERLTLPFSWKAAAAGIPLFVIYLLLYMITATLILLVWPNARDALTFRYVNSAPFWLTILFIVVNSVFEELTVTAYVITSLSRDGAALAITASTLLRFAYHLYQGPVASISIIPLGLLFGTMFWRWRNVWPLIVAHTIANVIAFAVTPGR